MTDTKKPAFIAYDPTRWANDPIPTALGVVFSHKDGNGYPGNCSGHLIKDLITFLGATTVYDPLSGSGTCKEVCRDLGIDCWSGDIHQGFDACEPRFTEAFSLCWIHPPYFRQKVYSSDSRDLSRAPTYEDFLARYDQLIRACAQAVKPGGHLAVLMGDYVDKDYGYLPLVYHTKRLAFAAGLRQTMTDIIRFSHNASSSRKVYKTAFVPGLHDTCVVFTRPPAEAG